MISLNILGVAAICLAGVSTAQPIADDFNTLRDFASAYETIHNAYVVSVCEYDQATVRSYKIASDQGGAFYALRYADLFGDQGLPIAQYISFDGETLYSQREPYVYSTISYASLAAGKVDTNLLSAPWPVLPSLVQMLLDSNDTSVSADNNTVVAESGSVGLRLEWDPSNLALVSISRLNKGEPLLTYEFSGFDRSFPPRPALCAVTYKGGTTGIVPEVYQFHELELNSPHAVSLLRKGPPDDYYLREVKSNNVYNQQGELKYNASERDRKLTGETNWLSRWWTWGLSVILIVGGIGLMYQRSTRNRLRKA